MNKQNSQSQKQSTDNAVLRAAGNLHTTYNIAGKQWMEVKQSPGPGPTIIFINFER